jgi:phage terminase large subunit-like protein
MIEGPSGLRAVAHPQERPHFEPSRRRLVWPSGAEARLFSAEDPDGLRGYQFDAAWGDELCKWRYAEETWSNLQLALRLGPRPRQVMTTTPRPTTLLKRLIAARTTARSHASTYENAAHLAPAFLAEIAAEYEGTALGRQELWGEIVEDIEGALWTWEMIEAARVPAPPADLARIVVAVDPPVSAGPDADECGVIVAGVDRDTGEAIAYVLADWSLRGSPRAWAERAVAAYTEYEADRIVVETNQGGDMARAVIEQVDAAVPVRDVRATRGKRLRAEPVAALYERRRVRHVGAFAALEDQMTSFTGAASDKSPDRLDALVWAVSELMFRPRTREPRVKRV